MEKGRCEVGERLISPEEAAKILGLHINTVRLWLRTGKIQGKKFGKVWRIKESEIMDFGKEKPE